MDLLERTLEAENRRADASGLIVVIFAHGWRHVPDVCDGNVVCFRTFLAQAQADSAAMASVAGGRIPPKRLVAIYVGWRGLSSKVQPFEGFSFWARKKVSHRIADGDLVELRTRAELFVRRANADGPDRARLIVIGHSLGGTMVHAALSNILKTRILEALDRQDHSDPRESVIRGFGDLVVLINPAFEASLYAPVHELTSRFRRFSPLQTPVLITVASETDGPNSSWFPLGRRVESLFERTGDRSPRREIVTAVGNYADELVHGHNGIFTTYLVDFVRRVMIESNAQHHLRP